jgi:hypothetical protein
MQLGNILQVMSILHIFALMISAGQILQSCWVYAKNQLTAFENWCQNNSIVGQQNICTGEVCLPNAQGKHSWLVAPHEQTGEREDLTLNNRGEKNNKKEPKTTVKKGGKKNQTRKEGETTQKHNIYKKMTGQNGFWNSHYKKIVKWRLHAISCEDRAIIILRFVQCYQEVIDSRQLQNLHPRVQGRPAIPVTKSNQDKLLF